MIHQPNINSNSFLCDINTPFNAQVTFINRSNAISLSVPGGKGGYFIKNSDVSIPTASPTSPTSLIWIKHIPWSWQKMTRVHNYCRCHFNFNFLVSLMCRAFHASVTINLNSLNPFLYDISTPSCTQVTFTNSSRSNTISLSHFRSQTIKAVILSRMSA